MSDGIQRVATDLGAVIEAAADDRNLSTQELRRVLRFVARVAHVVEQALQDVYGLAVEVKHVASGDKRELQRLRRELDLVRARSAYSKAEEICSRLRHLREQFENDVALLLRCSQGDRRWQELFWLLEEREGRIIQLVEASTSDMAQRLDALEDTGIFGRSQAKVGTIRIADDTTKKILISLRELRDIRDRIFGLSGQAGFLELTESDVPALRQQAHQLNVQITTGDLYRTDITNATVGAVAIGSSADAHGNAGRDTIPDSKSDVSR